MRPCKCWAPHWFLLCIMLTISIVLIGCQQQLSIGFFATYVTSSHHHTDIMFYFCSRSWSSCLDGSGAHASQDARKGKKENFRKVFS